MYFRPACGEVHKIAAQIGSNDVERQVSMLKDLRIGEAVSVGDFEVAGKQITRPIITHTDFSEAETKKMVKLKNSEV